MLKRIALTGLTIATVFSGARLTLAAFATVLPPGFAAWTDETYDEVHFFVRWMAIEQFEHLEKEGRWAGSLEELLPRVQVDDYANGFDLGFASSRDSVWITARSRGGRYACRLDTDARHARAYVAQPNHGRWRWASEEPSELAIHERMECRRTTWPWRWLSVAGLGRLTAPPERYASTDYIDRASDSPR